MLIGEVTVTGIMIELVGTAQRKGREEKGKEIGELQSCITSAGFSYHVMTVLFVSYNITLKKLSLLANKSIQ